jgi:hypothetical protein
MGCTDNVGNDNRKCLKTKDDGYNQCSKTQDNGYNSCSQTADEGYNSCDSWGPFSFICDAWTWVSNIVCVAWTWISNIVCVAWTWVSNIVCVLWSYASASLCGFVDVISTLVNTVVTTIEGVISVILDAVSFVVLFVFQIPIIGRTLNWLWNVALTIAYATASLVDVIGTLIGIMPEKRLRLLVINQEDENGAVVASEADMLASINVAIQVYRDQANIRILPIKLFNYRTPFSGNEQANADDYINTVTTPAGASTLDVDCGGNDFVADLGTAGADFQDIMLGQGFWTSFRRLIGYGAPICAFAVRSFASTYNGCSLGPLTDYIMVNFKGAVGGDNASGFGPDSILPHEMGHCCGLLHVSAPNLMAPNTQRQLNLDTWQVAIIRSSRHVTYF